jgi:hypothetical protein
LPEAVRIGNGEKGVAGSQTIPVLIEAIRKQQKGIERSE